MPFDQSGRYYDDGSTPATKRDIQDAITTIAESRASIQSHQERTLTYATDTIVSATRREVGSWMGAIGALLFLNLIFGFVNLCGLVFLGYELWWLK